MKPIRYYFLIYIKRLPSAWLLLVQSLMLISLPLLNQNVEGPMVSWFLGTVALVMVALVIRNGPLFTWVGVVLVLFAGVLSGWALLKNSHHLFAVAHIFEAIAYFYAALGMVMHIFKNDRVSREDLFSVAVVFTLFVWGFAFLFSVCQQWYPNSFTAFQNAEAPRTWLELLFMSFAIFSGVGMTDVLPILPAARVLAALEMFAGVMYLTLVVTRLVGMAKSSLHR